MSSHQFLFSRFSSMCKELRVAPVFHLHTARGWCMCGVRCITGSLWREWDVIYVWDRTWRGSGPVVRSYWKTYSNWHPVQGEESFRGRHQQVLLRWKIVDITQTRISLQCNLLFSQTIYTSRRNGIIISALAQCAGQKQNQQWLAGATGPGSDAGSLSAESRLTGKGTYCKSCWPFSVSSLSPGYCKARGGGPVWDHKYRYVISADGDQGGLRLSEGLPVLLGVQGKIRLRIWLNIAECAVCLPQLC